MEHRYFAFDDAFALGLAGAVSVFFGLCPRQAAALNPIEALRYE